jgi:hypothetical protein
LAVILLPGENDATTVVEPTVEKVSTNVPAIGNVKVLVVETAGAISWDFFAARAIQ